MLHGSGGRRRRRPSRRCEECDRVVERARFVLCLRRRQRTFAVTLGLSRHRRRALGTQRRRPDRPAPEPGRPPARARRQRPRQGRAQPQPGAKRVGRDRSATSVASASARCNRRLAAPSPAGRSLSAGLGSPPPFLGNRVYVIDGATCDAANTTGCGETPPSLRSPRTRHSRPTHRASPLTSPPTRSIPRTSPTASTPAPCR